MLGIGRHTDYAARLILHLACLEPGTRVTIAEVAAQRLLPTAFVRRLVGKLTRVGILTTVRGLGGGIRLGRPAAQITLLDLVNAMEGGVALNHCVNDFSVCPLASNCPVQTAWSNVTQTLEGSLAQVTFAALAMAPPHHIDSHRLRAAQDVKPGRHKPAAGAR